MMHLAYVKELEHIQECARILTKAVLLDSPDVPFLEGQLCGAISSGGFARVMHEAEMKSGPRTA